MLDIKFIREHRETIEKALRDRGVKVDYDKFLSLDSVRRNLITEVEGLKQKRNESSQKIGALLREKKDASKLMKEMKAISQNIKEIDAKVGEITNDLQELLLTIPNIPHPSVPVGPDQKSNKKVREWGKIKSFNCGNEFYYFSKWHY